MKRSLFVLGFCLLGLFASAQPVETAQKEVKNQKEYYAGHKKGNKKAKATKCVKGCKGGKACTCKKATGKACNCK